MTSIFIVAIALFIVSSFLVGTLQALWLAVLYLGFALIVLGILMFSSYSFREKYYRTYMHDPESDRVLSAKEKQFFHRYYFPQKPILAGICLIAIYWGTHQQLVAEIGSWLKRLL